MQSFPPAVSFPADSLTVESINKRKVERVKMIVNNKTLGKKKG